MQAVESGSEFIIVVARECLYRFLSAAVLGPYDDAWMRVRDGESQRLVLLAAELLRDEAAPDPDPLAPGERAIAELDLTCLLKEVARPLDQLRDEYDRVFGLVIPKECPPYETEYYPSKETFARSQQMADIAGFYRAFGLEPSSRRPERPDHLGLELEFMAFLLMKQRLAFGDSKAAEWRQVCERTQLDFFREHLAWWLPAFATGLGRKAAGGYLGALARVFAALVAAERGRLGLPAPARPVQPELIERPEEQSGCTTCPLLQDR